MDPLLTRLPREGPRPPPSRLTTKEATPLAIIHRKSHALPTTSQPAPRLLPRPASPSLLLLATRYIGFTNTRSARREVHLDRLQSPVGEGFSDLFPRTAIVPYLEQRYILFCCLFNILPLLLGLQRRLTCLGIYSSLVIGRNLCRRLFTRIDL